MQQNPPMTYDTPGFIAAVDDDQRILDSLQTLLESADHAVCVFASGQALLESGCVAKIDCLISDIGMPGMDGFALSKLVQTARPRLPIILITGHPEMLKASPPPGLCDYRLFKKPFDAETLLGAVAEALRNTRAMEPRS
jgi:FixJ family two-component response regulator